MGESGSADGVVIFGVGGPLGLVDCTAFSTLCGRRTLLVLVLRVKVARVGERSLSSLLKTIDALLSVRLKGL